MRILVVADETLALLSPLGDATAWLRRLLGALSPGFQIGLLVPQARERWAAEVRPAGAPVFTVPTLAPTHPEGTRRRAAELAAFARRQEVDLLHLAGAGLAALVPGLREAGLPTVLTLLGGDPPGEAAVEILPPGVDLERFQAGDRKAARQALGLPPDRPILLAVCRLELGEGPLEALAALRLLADLDPLLVLVGAGPDAERIAARARFLGEGNLVISEPVSDDQLSIYYQAADLALLPARDETAAGLGLPAIEAAASALPVVASRVGALAEVVLDGKTGLLVPPRDPAALAKAVRALLADPERAAALGGAARRRAEETYDPAKLAARYAEIYREATPGAPVVLQVEKRPPRRKSRQGPRPTPRIAVILPTWRCRRWLPRAIEGVLAQTCPAVDLYVADDASGDVDPELLERFPTVTFLSLREQGGPYRIDNLLLSLTESELVAFHDADDWSHPERLATQAEYLLERGFDGCGSWCRFEDLNGDPVSFRTLPPYVSLGLRERLDTLFLNPTALYRREVFDRLGGFDAGTRFGADSELIFRAARSFELGNVQRFLYSATTRPDALSRSADTGFESPARRAYRERLWAAAEAVRTGAAPPPPPGVTLLGEPVREVSSDVVARLRPGQGNRTLKERP
jgi:hypothetical protein